MLPKHVYVLKPSLVLWFKFCLLLQLVIEIHSSCNRKKYFRQLVSNEFQLYFFSHDQQSIFYLLTILHRPALFIQQYVQLQIFVYVVWTNITSLNNYTCQCIAPNFSKLIDMSQLQLHNLKLVIRNELFQKEESANFSLSNSNKYFEVIQFLFRFTFILSLSYKTDATAVSQNLSLLTFNLYYKFANVRSHLQS